MIYPSLLPSGATPPPQRFTTRTAEKAASRSAYRCEFGQRNNRRSRREQLKLKPGERCTPKMATPGADVVKRAPNRRLSGHVGRRVRAVKG